MVTDECAVYCRHCFRRHFSGGRRGYLSASELRGVEDYLKEHGEIKELILSGGDPLTLSDRRIEELIRRIRTLRRDLVLRIATRIPVVLPSRISASLVSILSEAAPVFLVSQFNHPREINEASGAALRSLLEGGVSLLNQAVLLRGVNDDVDTLEELFGALVSRQVFSYYLFQADLAAGTSHLRVSIRRGFELMRELRRRLSGVSLPVYALDLPGGGGKIPLTESYLLADGASRGGEGEAVAYETEEGIRFFRFTSPEGGVFEYPDESSPRTAFE